MTSQYGFIQLVTASWSNWVAQTDPSVLATVTHVQLRNDKAHGGYDVHISAWNADQTVVDRLAAALGGPSNDGWEPNSSVTAHQWSLAFERDGLSWHLTATTPVTAKQPVSVVTANGVTL